MPGALYYAPRASVAEIIWQRFMHTRYKKRKKQTFS